MVRVAGLRPTSRGSARVLMLHFVNDSVAIDRVGNREWGLRPATRTTDPEGDLGVRVSGALFR